MNLINESIPQHKDCIEGWRIVKDFMWRNQTKLLWVKEYTDDYRFARLRYPSLEETNYSILGELERYVWIAVDELVDWLSISPKKQLLIPVSSKAMQAYDMRRKADEAKQGVYGDYNSEFNSKVKGYPEIGDEWIVSRFGKVIILDIFEKNGEEYCWIQIDKGIEKIVHISEIKN